MMTTTAATTTDNATVDALRLEAIVSDLCARGFRALPSSREGEFLFSRDASTTAPIVAMAVRFVVAADGSVRTQSGFTRGGLCLSDAAACASAQTDASARWRTSRPAAPRPALSTARRTPGGGDAFVSDHVRWPATRVLASLPKFAQMLDRMGLEEALGAHPEYRAQRDAPDSSRARLPCFNALARRHLETVHREGLKFGRVKDIGLEDPVFAATAAAEDNPRTRATADNATLA
jgi:hypothetical protein